MHGWKQCLDHDEVALVVYEIENQIDRPMRAELV